MRELVGPTDTSAFDNSAGERVFPEIPEGLYADVFDFGCGCGRIARRLIQQRPRPLRYVGVDLHAGMIQWCRRNLEPHAGGFTFLHHDVFNRGFNPGDGKPLTLPFPVADSNCSLVIAWSIFTHLIEEQTGFYLRECARILRPTGLLYSTWFLFDKHGFPMMQEFQNALYINVADPSNAVIYDKEWLRHETRDAGLTIVSVAPPEIRGFAWIVSMTRSGPGIREAEFPPDTAPAGIARPPAPGRDPSKVNG